LLLFLLWPGREKARTFEVEYYDLTSNYKNSGFKNLDLYLLHRFSAALKERRLRPEDKSLLFLHTNSMDTAGHDHLPHTE
jgi:hypothetical protein